MATDILTLMCATGHVATAAQLRHYFTARQVAQACGGGMIRRLSRGMYGCAHIDDQLVRAAQAGGRLDCVSSLARHEVWSGLERPGTHLRMEPHQHTRRLVPGGVVHWSGTVQKASLLEVVGSPGTELEFAL